MRLFLNAYFGFFVDHIKSNIILDICTPTVYPCFAQVTIYRKWYDENQKF